MARKCLRRRVCRSHDPHRSPSRVWASAPDGIYSPKKHSRLRRAKGSCSLEAWLILCQHPQRNPDSLEQRMALLTIMRQTCIMYVQLACLVTACEVLWSLSCQDCSLPYSLIERLGEKEDCNHGRWHSDIENTAYRSFWQRQLCTAYQGNLPNMIKFICGLP